jgi:hypothetical protein
MKLKLTSIAAAFLTLACIGAHAESLSFTSSSVVPLPGTPQAGVVGGADICAGPDVCAPTLTFNTTAGGLLTVTAQDDFIDTLAYVTQPAFESSGLGVLTGYKLLGTFVPVDLNGSVSAHDEKLILSFASPVAISAAYFFPDDRSHYSLTHELDSIDAFTVSVDGKSAQSYSFGHSGGQPTLFATPLTGNTFTFGYHKPGVGSPEDYYLAALTVSSVPEPSSMALVVAGLLSAGVITRRKKRTG